MATNPLVPSLIEPLFQLTTMVSLGLDPTVDASAQAVRIGWQTTGQPASSISEDVVYIRAEEIDNDYNRIRDEAVADAPPDQVSITVTYTRVWRVFWTLYGPTSFDNARKIKSALFTQAIHDLLLQAYNTYGQLPSGIGGYGGSFVPIYLVTDVIAPRRVPENFGGQWWERVDFEALFNEGVTETVLVNAVASSEVIVETERGVVIDEVIEGN